MKKIRQTIVSVLTLFAVQAVLCVVYCHTYTSVEYDFNGRFQGVIYWIMLMIAFLAGPISYYLAGLSRKDTGSKYATLIIVLICNIMVTVLGIVAFFNPTIRDIYSLINAPSYLYYSLFSGSVIYVAVAAMIASSLFPVLFFNLGFTKKPRQNNQLDMDEVNEIAKENKK